MSPWTQLYMHDPASTSMMVLTSFHDLIMTIMVLILTIISYMMMFISLNTYTNRSMKEAHKIEFIWTISPSMILISLAIPSLHLLFMMDELNNPSMTIKTIGHQWYWSYEYSAMKKISFDSFMLSENKLNNGEFRLLEVDNWYWSYEYSAMKKISFDSFMLSENKLNNGEFRLLEVDNRLIAPMYTEIRLLVTASDVIHAWTIPSLGIKIDAIPGRLNQVSLSTNRAGIFYGQCSEICGMNHSLMPIVLESVNMNSFINWTKNT